MFGLGFVNNAVRHQIEQSREVGKAFLDTLTGGLGDPLTPADSG